MVPEAPSLGLGKGRRKDKAVSPYTYNTQPQNRSPHSLLIVWAECGGGVKSEGPVGPSQHSLEGTSGSALATLCRMWQYFLLNCLDFVVLVKF